MSKATFYEHFANKEECIIALFDDAAGVVAKAMAAGRPRCRHAQTPPSGCRAGTRAFLDRADRVPRVRPDAAGRDHRRRAPGRPAARPDHAAVRRHARRRERRRGPPRADRALRLALRRVRDRRRDHRARLAPGPARRAGRRTRARAGDRPADRRRARAGATRERALGPHARARGRRLPPLPAAGGVARGGGAGQAGRLRRPRTTGAGRCPASAIPPPACSCSAWRRPPTAATAPGGSSPATARATGCSPRCGARGSPTSPTSVSPRRRAGAARLLRHRRGPLRAAGEPADAGRARQLPARTSRASWRCCERVRVIVCLGGFAWDAALRRAGRRARPRPTFAHGAEADGRARHAARLLPPQPAEHVHRAADRADDGRGVRAREGAGRRGTGMSRMRSHSQALLAALQIADPPERWEALGFAVEDGAWTRWRSVRLGAGQRHHGAGRSAASPDTAEIDGLPTTRAPLPRPQRRPPHPNGAIGIDHVVITDARLRPHRRGARGGRAGAAPHPRRRRVPPGLPPPRARRSWSSSRRDGAARARRASGVSS